jgi:glutamate racemase
VLLCDDAYAPYARKRPDVVVRRVSELLAQLRADGAKLIVLASPQASLDALALQAASRVALIGLEAPIAQAGAACDGAGSMRGRLFGQALRRQRGASAIHVEEWVLDEATVALRVPSLMDAGVGALALTSPGLSRLRPAIEAAAGGALAIVEAGDVAALRAERALRHGGLLVRRQRAGRLVTLSSNPQRAAALL